MSAIVWRREHVAEIDSTNSWLVARASAGVAEGLVIFADHQSAGRGRLERTWESAPGGSLLCSILLRPRVGPDELQLVVAAVALAARAALVRLSGLRPALKWPNDLIVGDEKVGGLLAELTTSDGDAGIVVGIGVNLTYAGPGGVAATSVLEQTGLTITPEALLDILLDELEPRRALLDDDEGRAALRDEYARALATLGRLVRVERLHDAVVGVATSVDQSGRLLLDVGGDVMAFSAGDVVHVRAQGN